MLDYIDDIENTVLSWEQTSIHPHKFGGIQFNVNDKEIGHIHGNGLLDVPLSKAMKENMIATSDGRVKDHHIFKKSGWISLYITESTDRDLAVHVLKESYQKALKN